jgi:polyphosphate kinase 2 (PPK2 family)
VTEFESLLVRSGLHLRKYYLDISRDEQKERLTDRNKDPLKAWKISPVDALAIKKWKPYTKARDEMFLRTSHGLAPWRVVKGQSQEGRTFERDEGFARELFLPGEEGGARPA